MARLGALDPAKLTDEQKTVFEAIAGRRGQVPQPMQLLLRSPELADKAQALGQFLRFRTTLTPRLSELAIMVTARHWGSDYEWTAHKQAAIEGGIDAAKLDAIANNQPVHFEQADEQAVYDFVRAVLTHKKVPADIYQRAIETLGERKLVEVVGLVGFYDLIAIVLATFDVELPAGRSPELK